MLILSRRINEDIVIENVCTIRVLAIEHDTVKLGIECNSNINFKPITINFTEIVHAGWVGYLKLNETIFIDSVIKIKFLKIKSNAVRLGFEAPKHININRKEIVEHG